MKNQFLMKMSVYYRNYLPSDISDIIDIYIIEWGNYDIKSLNNLQISYLKDSLKEITSFTGKHDLTDIATYNQIIKEKLNLNYAFCKSAENGSLSLLHYYESKGANDYNLAIYRASRQGHLDIVKFCERKGANSYIMPMAFAAYGGHIDIIKYFESKGANDYNYVMACAACGNHFDVVKFCESKGANDYNWVMAEYARIGNLDMVKYCESKGANDYGRAMSWVKEDNYEIINYLKTKI